tara:strand:- start:1344 stop:2282 length:939 start_codon:yes stop_codon:yes gene_type:complete
MVIAPGLHYDGPKDVRMERLAVVLASVGIVVLSPSIPDYRELILRPGAALDFQDAVAFFLKHPKFPPGAQVGIMSISFGSWLALEAAASPELCKRICGVMIYGGFGDWRQTMRFCLEGMPGAHPPRLHDPLNRPVIYLNLLDTIPDAPEDLSAIEDAWRTYVKATWGREIYKRGGRHAEVARKLASGLERKLRPLFLEGCGVDSPSNERIHAALKASDNREWLDPRSRLENILCPVSLVHGADDDVIPIEELDRLKEAFPAGHPVETFRTGLFAHAGRVALQNIPGLLPRALKEVWTMGKILGALCRSAGLR